MTDMDHSKDAQNAHEFDTPNTPAEHKICGVTLFFSILFLAAVAYYMLAPMRDGLSLTLLQITGGLFGLSVLNFLIAGFRGKLCGCKKN